MVTICTPDHIKFPVLEYYDVAKNLWQLMEDFEFIWLDPKTRRMEKFCIPAGEEYDKASVPEPLWGIARADGPWELASLFHDKIYEFEGVLPKGWYQVYDKEKDEWDEGPKWSRARADWFLAWVGHLGGAPWWQAQEYRWAVRLNPENWGKF